MATRERLIVEQVIRALRDAQIEGVDDRVYEERGFTIPATSLPAIDVLTGDSDVEVMDLGDLQLGHRLRVEVAVHVREGIDRASSAVADPIVAAVHRTLMRSAALAALVRAVTPDGSRLARQDSGDGAVLRRTITYVIDHVTEVDDLERAP